MPPAGCVPSACQNAWACLPAALSGPAPPASTVLRIPLRETRLRRAVDPGASTGPAGLTARARPEARPERARRTSRIVPHSYLFSVGYHDRAGNDDLVSEFVNARGSAAEGPHACPCCGFLTLSERSSYEICPVCFWEDDGQDEHDADVVRGGPNRKLSLTIARENYRSFGASDTRRRQFVRPPLAHEYPARHGIALQASGHQLSSSVPRASRVPERSGNRRH
jgi:hypothetical protein